MTVEKKAYLGIAMLVLVYIGLTLSATINPELLARYHISETKAQVLSLTIIVPLAAIWIVGVYGFVQLWSYAKLIAKNADGIAFRNIAIGLGIIAFRSPVSSILTSLFNQIGRNHAEILPYTTVATNYVGVLTAVIGFTFIAKGTNQLIGLTKKKPDDKNQLVAAIIAIGLIAAYTYLAIGRAGFQHPLAPGGKANFYLPSWLIVSTIIVPYVYGWYIGLIAVGQLHFYCRNIAGTLYRQSLHMLSYGIAGIIFASIALQFLSSQANRINKLNLAPLLIIVYVLLIGIAVGFSLVARGAKNVKKIEEV